MLPRLHSLGGTRLHATPCSFVPCCAVQGPPFDTVVVTSRVHPGETPSSFVVEGFIDFVLSEEPEAIALRNRLVIKVVPMLNPDGVFLGNYRCSSIGQDLNRCYQSPKQWNHPEIYVSDPPRPVSISFAFILPLVLVFRSLSRSRAHIYLFSFWAQHVMTTATAACSYYVVVLRGARRP